MKNTLTTLFAMTFISLSCGSVWAQAVTASGLTQADLDREGSEWLEERKNVTPIHEDATEPVVVTSNDNHDNKNSSDESGSNDKIVRRTTSTATMEDESNP